MEVLNASLAALNRSTAGSDARTAAEEDVEVASERNVEEPWSYDVTAMEQAKVERMQGNRAKRRRYSGRTVLRMPEELHADLAEVAQGYKLSMNSLIVYLLSWSLGKGNVQIDRKLRLSAMAREMRRMRWQPPGRQGIERF
jgi:hypothetical protein